MERKPPFRELGGADFSTSVDGLGVVDLHQVHGDIVGLYICISLAGKSVGSYGIQWGILMD